MRPEIKYERGMQLKKVMVVAGGEWQCPLVQKIKEMGYYVICTNLYENSPAFQYADIGIVADVLDKEKNLEIAKRYEIDAILTDQSDIAVPTVAYVAEKLQLKGIGIEMAKLFTNKYLMREFCKENGFAYPDYQLCHTVQEVERFVNSHKKVIIKPLDAQSSRGISIIQEKSDLNKCFQEALSYSNAKKAIIAEEYIEGVEFTVDGLKTKDRYEVLAISKKKHYSYNSSIAKELYFQNYDNEYDYDKLRKCNKEMVCKMGLPFGLTHAEYKYMNGEFYLIEIGARGGGTKISSDIVPYMSGVDSNAILVKSLLGEDEEYLLEYCQNKCAVLGFFDFPEGKVAEISGVEKVRRLEGVSSLELNFARGDQIGEASDDRSRLGHYIIFSDTDANLRKTEQNIKKAISIRYE